MSSTGINGASDSIAAGEAVGRSRNGDVTRPVGFLWPLPGVGGKPERILGVPFIVQKLYNHCILYILTKVFGGQDWGGEECIRRNRVKQ